MKKLIPTIALLLMGSSTAFAQVGASTGFPLGEKSRIHTNLDLSVGFDSNVERFDSGSAATGADGKLSDWRALIRPGLLIDVPGNSLKFNLVSHLTINQLLGAGRDAETRFGADIGVGLQLGSDASVISFRLDNQLVRTPNFVDIPGAVAIDEFRASEWNNNGTARITLRPGGRALEFDLGYMFRLSAYDDDAALGASHRHGGLFEARWKFLPKTALLFHADVSRFIPFKQGGDPPPPPTVAGTPFRVTIGAIGQVTTRITAELTAGYEDTFADVSEASKRGPIGNAVLTYQFNETTALSLGYRRRIRPVVALNGYSSDMPFLQLKVGLLGRVAFKLYGHYEWRNFSDNANSSVQVAVGDARVEYWFFEWLMAAVNYRLQAQNPSTDNPILQDFQRHQVLFIAGFRY